jgi:integrase
MARSKAHLTVVSPVAPAPEPAPVDTATKPEVARSAIARAAQARDKPGVVKEVHSEAVKGLWLRIEKSGTRSYYVRLPRKAGRRAGGRMMIGSVTHMTLGEAEDKARKMLGDPEKWAAERKRHPDATLEGWLDGPYRDHALAQLKGGARSIKRVKAIWKPLLKKRMTDIHLATVVAMGNKRKVNDGVAPATINRDANALRGVVTHWATTTKSANPLAGMKPLDVPDDETIRYLPPEENKRLRKALADRDERLRNARDNANEWRIERGYELMPERGTYADHMTPMVLISLNTGLRQGELFSLEWSSVDLVRKTLTVKASHAKGNRTRVVPLNTEVRTIFTAIKPEHAKGLVFVSPVTKGRFNNVKKAWGEIAKAAKLPDLRWHDLRHDFASQLVMRGVSLYKVQGYLGHANSRMTQRYARLSPETMAEGVELLGVPT